MRGEAALFVTIIAEEENLTGMTVIVSKLQQNVS